MSHPNVKPDPWLKAYLDLLGNVGKALVFCTVVAAVWSTIRYCLTASNIEQINNRSLSPWLTCLLLWIPIVIQALVFWRLRKQITEASSDVKLRNFFRFYSRRMALSLLAYTLLWWCYAHALWQSGNWFAWFLKWLPPIGIVVLMGIIIHATYLVTRLSFRNDDILLTEDDVSSHYRTISDALQSEAGTPQGIIRDWLSRDRDYKISKAAGLRNIENVDASHLAEALNRLICSCRFYNQIKNSDPAATNAGSDGCSYKKF